MYVDGAFDLLLPCHIRFLQKARELGDFLIVGVHRVTQPARAFCTIINWIDLQEGGGDAFQGAQLPQHTPST